MTVLERFMEKVSKQDNGCWLWTASKLKSGYGMFGMDSNRPTLAHRASWIVFCGDIPEGMNVCHKCDNPSCVNPEHLFLGTQYDNLHDMINKGRFVHKAHYGTENGRAKLDEIKVAEIRRQLLTKQSTPIELAEKYLVSASAIRRIANGKSWVVA